MTSPFMSLWRRIVGPEICRLRFFMRSGNSFILDGVKEYEIEARGDEIVKIRLEQIGHRNRLLVKTIALGQIEAIVRLDGKGVA